jgi:hypothetical protein
MEELAPAKKKLRLGILVDSEENGAPAAPARGPKHFIACCRSPVRLLHFRSALTGCLLPVACRLFPLRSRPGRKPSHRPKVDARALFR